MGVKDRIIVGECRKQRNLNREYPLTLQSLNSRTEQRIPLPGSLLVIIFIYIHQKCTRMYRATNYLCTNSLHISANVRHLQGKKFQPKICQQHNINIYNIYIHAITFLNPYIYNIYIHAITFLKFVCNFGLLIFYFYKFLCINVSFKMAKIRRKM